MTPFRILALALMTLGLSACTCSKTGAPPTAAPAAAPVGAVALSQSSPEDTVKSFLTLSSGAQSMVDRDRLQKLCVGEMRRAFERMTEEGFRLTYLNNGIKLKEIKVIEAKVENDAAKLRYRIAVDNAQGTDTTAETNEREVELVRTQGSWYIETIRLKDTDRVAFVNGMLF